MKLLKHIIKAVLFTILPLPIILVMAVILWILPQTEIEQRVVRDLIIEVYKYKTE